MLVLCLQFSDSIDFMGESVSHFGAQFDLLLELDFVFV